MGLAIAAARAVLEANGFRLYCWGRKYRVTRDLPPYGQRPGQWFHKRERGFEASEVSLSWVRRLAQALADAEAGCVTSWCCAEAWAADRKAELAWAEAGVAHREASSWRRSEYTLEQVFDLGVAELKAAGAARMAQLTRQVLVEAWASEHRLATRVAAAA
jgi:hypothetical protein